MTIKVCSSGTKIDTKKVTLDVTYFSIGNVKYKALWFTCPCCGSTSLMKRPLKK